MIDENLATDPLEDEPIPDTETPLEEVPETASEVTTEELEKAIKDIVQEVEIQESAFRKDQLKNLKKFDSFWHGDQRVYWSEIAKDWVSADTVTDEEYIDELEALGEVVNIYKAYGESVIAALSTGIPVVKFFPDDADNAADILAAKAHSRVAELIQKRNKAPLLLIEALFTLWNQNFVAAYHYPMEDKRFGESQIANTTTVPVEINKTFCAACGNDVQEGQPCPTCGSQETTQLPETVQQEQIEYTTVPKSSQVIEIYGPLNVLIPRNARTVSDCGYLILSTENDIAKVLATYNNLAEKLTAHLDEDATYRDNSLSDQYTVTVKQAWIRPWMYWRLGKGNLNIIQALNRNYPNGCYAVIVDDVVAEIYDEKLDDRWTISKSPLSRTLIADPIGKALISLQESRNDMYSLTMETVKHGIPETFYDARILDGTKYSQVEIRPGMLTPVNRQPGQNIQESFHQLKTATLSKEIDQVNNRIDQDGQFVIGAYPSIYGGPSEGSGGTLGEYAMSRNQALQRLQITWKVLNAWWTEILSKVVPDFIKNMMEDEKFTKPQGGSFVNVWIRKAELEGGKVGQIEPESSEQMPLSWAQKKDLLIQALQMKNPVLEATIFHPENANLVAQMVGFSELYIPGDEDRTKQLVEINTLINSQPSLAPMPMPGPEMMQPPDSGQMPGQEMMPPPQPQEQASVMPELEVDNHPVHIEVCRAWMNSDVGQETKATNPAGYSNVLLHLKAHLMMAAPPPMPTNEPGQAPSENEPAKNPESQNLEPPNAAPVS